MTQIQTVEKDNKEISEMSTGYFISEEVFSENESKVEIIGLMDYFKKGFKPQPYAAIKKIMPDINDYLMKPESILEPYTLVVAGDSKVDVILSENLVDFFNIIGLSDYVNVEMVGVNHYGLKNPDLKHNVFTLDGLVNKCEELKANGLLLDFDKCVCDNNLVKWKTSDKKKSFMNEYGSILPVKFGMVFFHAYTRLLESLKVYKRSLFPSDTNNILKMHEKLSEMGVKTILNSMSSERSIRGFYKKAKAAHMLKK